MQPLALFTGPFAWAARLGVVAIVLLAAFVGGWVKGNQHGTKKLTDYQGEQAVAALKVIEKQDKATERVVTQYRDRIQVVQGVTTTIEKEIPVYVSQKSDAGCVVPVGFVRMHNYAASAIPAATEGDNDVPSGVSLSAVAEAVNSNYGTFHKVMEQLIACQAWIAEQYQATNDQALE